MADIGLGMIGWLPRLVANMGMISIQYAGIRGKEDKKHMLHITIPFRSKFHQIHGRSIFCRLGLMKTGGEGEERSAGMGGPLSSTPATHRHGRGVS